MISGLDFISIVEKEFLKNAIRQKSYMRNKFDFFGLLSPVRKHIKFVANTKLSNLNRREALKIIKR